MSGDIEQVARAAFAAFGRRDVEELLSLLAEDVSWHTPGTSLLAGDFYGRAAVRPYLRRALELTGDTLRVHPVDLLVGRDHVAAVVDLSGERGGRVLDTRAIQLLGFRGERILMRRLFPADQGSFDRFWSA